jgi:YjbE family integral membrane protein
VDQFFIALLGIIWIDLLLSGDNAVVIALVSNRLPEHQQKWGIIGGTAAAVLLRVVMSFFAVLLLGVPGLSLLGGLFLLHVAYGLLKGEEEAKEDAVGRITLTAAIGTIAVADASMSLDNVLAVAALAHGSVELMVIGVLISIPLVIAGAAIISKVIARFPIMVWAGAGLLGWVAGGIIAHDPWAAPYLDHLVSSAVGAGLVLVAGAVKRFDYTLSGIIARAALK